MRLMVLVAAMLDKAIGSDTSMFRDAVCWFYNANEGISLMENLNLAGVPFPKKPKELLEEKASEKAESKPPDDGSIKLETPAG